MAFCSQLCQKLSEWCRPVDPDEKNETTRLRVKCQNRYVSDEALLDSCSGADGVSGDSEPDLTRLTPGLGVAPGLSVSEAHLDRVQPPRERLYRPDLDSASQNGAQDFGSVPDITVTAVPEVKKKESKGIKANNLRPDVMRHAQTIADISKFTLRDLKSQNSERRGFARASQHGFDRSHYESAGSLTRDAAPPPSAGVEDAKQANEIYGSVTIAASFNPHLKRLLVQLESVHSLPPRGHLAYDVLTEITLLPDCKPVKKAPVVSGDLNPTYNLDYALPLRTKDLRSKTLRVTVREACRLGPYEAVGHALLSLDGTVGETPERFALPLTRRAEPDDTLGRLLVSLSYRAADDRLSVVVMQARELRVSPSVHRLPQKTFEKHAKYDTFVKASLRCAGEKVKTKRSPVLAGSKEPFYNASFGFVLPQGFVDDASLVLSVVMRGPVRTDLVIGRVILGPFFSSAGGQPTQWGRALSTSDVVTQWHRLYL
ncbi:synaptotagmin-1-like [Amphibalanus amphitrite]|uniref:synaptotagmin-1-like n=1 Tax=Amphibalanus amphitrite TaxID=1232801 RepID=UPI001C9279C8|nr:synaptotagmin-1-like [Amphibalanus amphitrite]